MPFWRSYFHLIWSTLDRLPLIQEDIEASLFAHLDKTATDLGVYVYTINGWVDHIHMVVAIPPRLAPADVIRRLKGSSSYFVNHALYTNGNFQWQRGYGALSLGHLQRPIAEDYVNR